MRHYIFIFEVNIGEDDAVSTRFGQRYLASLFLAADYPVIRFFVDPEWMHCCLRVPFMRSCEELILNDKYLSPPLGPWLVARAYCTRSGRVKCEDREVESGHS